MATTGAFLATTGAGFSSDESESESDDSAFLATTGAALTTSLVDESESDEESSPPKAYLSYSSAFVGLATVFLSSFNYGTIWGSSPSLLSELSLLSYFFSKIAFFSAAFLAFFNSFFESFFGLTTTGLTTTTSSSDESDDSSTTTFYKKFNIKTLKLLLFLPLLF